MTKVEELRKELNADLGACHLALFRDDKGVTESIDSLISAAHAEGVAEGVSEFEKKRADTFEKLIDDHDTAFAKGVAEGKEAKRLEILSTLSWNTLITESHEKGVAEGAEQERERIRGESQMVGVDEDCIKFIGSVDNYVGAAFLVPVDAMDPPVFAPKEKP